MGEVQYIDKNVDRSQFKSSDLKQSNETEIHAGFEIQHTDLF